jgi:hypothetical protein
MAVLNEYTVGSRYFFETYPDYESKDHDILIIEDPPFMPYNHMMIIRGQGKDVFRYRPHTADEFINYTLELNVPMVIGKFLIKEFCEDWGITIDHLKKLKNLAEKMDDKHEYVKYIYNVFVDNNRFELTQEERDEAYSIYKRSKNL